MSERRRVAVVRCVTCGHRPMAQTVEPDGRTYICPSCGRTEVYGHTLHLGRYDESPTVTVPVTGRPEVDA